MKLTTILELYWRQTSFVFKASKCFPINVETLLYEDLTVLVANMTLTDFYSDFLRNSFQTHNQIKD